MERSSSLSVPTILTSHSLHGEDQLGEGGGCSISTSVVQPGMVPITAPESTGCTNLAPQHDGDNTESSGRAAPTCSGGTPSTSLYRELWCKRPFRQSDVNHADVMENINEVSLSQCLEKVE